MSYPSITYKYITLILGVLIMVFNSIMLIYIRKSKAHKHKPAGFVYVINMAVSDLFVGVVMVILKSMSPYMETTLANCVVAQFTYHAMRYLMVRFTLLVSVFNLVALTIDRLYAIRFPFAAQRMERRLHIKVCCGIWLLSLVMTLFFYIFVTHYAKRSLRYKDAIFPIATIPATVLFVVSYTMIFTVVCRTSNTVKKIEASVRRQHSNNPDIDKERQQAPQKIPKDKIAFVRLAVKTVAVFVICWLPLSILSIYKIFSTEAPDPNVECTLFVLALLNSLIDPFVYFAHFQCAIRELFGCCIKNRCRSRPIPAYTSEVQLSKISHFQNETMKNDETETKIKEDTA